MLYARKYSMLCEASEYKGNARVLGDTECSCQLVKATCTSGLSSSLFMDNHVSTPLGLVLRLTSWYH